MLVGEAQKEEGTVYNFCPPTRPVVLVVPMAHVGIIKCPSGIMTLLLLSNPKKQFYGVFVRGLLDQGWGTFGPWAI